MLQKLFVLYAVAGLLGFALADPRADLATPARKFASRRKGLDSARTRLTKGKGVALPHGIDANDVIRQVRQGREPKPSLELDSNPFTDPEFMPTPAVIPTSASYAQCFPSVAFDGTNYLVVWQDSRNGDPELGEWYDIYGARVSQSGSVLDPDGIKVSPNTMWGDRHSPAVAFVASTDAFVVQRDVGRLVRLVARKSGGMGKDSG